MYGKEKGRQYIHFVQSFSPDEDITPEIANEIAQKLISHPAFKGFQVLIATHTDTPHIHTHFVINSVNSETGLKWQLSAEELQSIKDYSDELCREYGLNVIDNDKKEKGHRSGGEYRSKQKGMSWKYEIFLAVTACMKTATSREDFIYKMNELGYQVVWNDNKTHITFISPDGKKCRNKKLYPPERFMKENMEKVFEENRKRLDTVEMRDNMKKELCMDTVYQLKQRCGNLQGVVLHSDRGSQYTSEAYRKLLKNCGIMQSLSGTGHCYDNARMESFFATLKKEKLYQIPTYRMKKEEVKTIVFRYIFIYYNRIRLYTGNPGCLPPSEYRIRDREKTAA